MQVMKGYSLIIGPSSLFNTRVHSCRHECFSDEKMNRHVPIERQLESVDRVIGDLR